MIILRIDDRIKIFILICLLIAMLDTYQEPDCAMEAAIVKVIINEFRVGGSKN